MRTDMAIVSASCFDYDSFFRAAAEALERQALVQELADEAFIAPVP